MNRLIVAAFDLLAPVAAYYVLRAAGVTELHALLLSALVPLARLLVDLVRGRRADRLVLLVLALALVSAAMTAATGSPEFLLAREGLITAVLGAVVLGSLARPRPVMYAVGRAVLAGAGHDPAPWDARWADSVVFCRLWWTITVIWGIGLLGDAVLRVVFALTLPVDVVPAVTTVQWIVLLVVLQILTQVLLRRPRHRALVFE